MNSNSVNRMTPHFGLMYDSTKINCYQLTVIPRIMNSNSVNRMISFWIENVRFNKVINCYIMLNIVQCYSFDVIETCIIMHYHVS